MSEKKQLWKCKRCGHVGGWNNGVCGGDGCNLILYGEAFFESNEPEQIICPVCRRSYNADMNMCPYCAPKPKPAPKPVPNPKPKSNKKAWIKNGIILAVLLLLGVASVFAVIMPSDNVFDRIFPAPSSETEEADPVERTNRIVLESLNTSDKAGEIVNTIDSNSEFLYASWNVEDTKKSRISIDAIHTSPDGTTVTHPLANKCIKGAYLTLKLENSEINCVGSHTITLIDADNGKSLGNWSFEVTAPKKIEAVLTTCSRSDEDPTINVRVLNVYEEYLWFNWELVSTGDADEVTLYGVNIWWDGKSTRFNFDWENQKKGDFFGFTWTDVDFVNPGTYRIEIYNAADDSLVGAWDFAVDHPDIHLTALNRTSTDKTTKLDTLNTYEPYFHVDLTLYDNHGAKLPMTVVETFPDGTIIETPFIYTYSNGVGLFSIEHSDMYFGQPGTYKVALKLDITGRYLQLHTFEVKRQQPEIKLIAISRDENDETMIIDSLNTYEEYFFIIWQLVDSDGADLTLYGVETLPDGSTERFSFDWENKKSGDYMGVKFNNYDFMYAGTYSVTIYNAADDSAVGTWDFKVID